MKNTPLMATPASLLKYILPILFPAMLFAADRATTMEEFYEQIANYNNAGNGVGVCVSSGAYLFKIGSRGVVEVLR